MGGKAVSPSAKSTENNKRLRVIVNKSKHAGFRLWVFEKGFRSVWSQADFKTLLEGAIMKLRHSQERCP